MPTRITALAAACAALLTSPRAGATERNETAEPGAVTRVDIELPAAHRITLRGTTGGVRLHLRNGDAPECQPEVTRDGARLRVTLPHGSRELRDRDCRWEVELAAPSNAAVTVDVGAGSASLDGFVAPLEISLGAGDVRGSARGEKLRVRTGAGAIDLSDLRAPLEVKTGAGSIELSFGTAPAGMVKASTGMGSIDVRMPGGTPVRASLSTGLGSVEKNLPIDQSAPTRIEASTGMGSITVGPT